MAVRTEKDGPARSARAVAARAGQAGHRGDRGPAVAGGMELGLWCDFRVMAEESYFGSTAAAGGWR